MSYLSTKSSSKSASFSEYTNILGESHDSSNFEWNSKASELNINLYNLNDLYKPHEEITMKVISPIDEICQILSPSEVFDKDVVKIGRDKENDVYCEDGYTSMKHCKIDLKKWFSKKTPWSKEYYFLLKIKKLPLHLCKQIFEFLQEPRRVVITDCGTFNGTFVSLLPTQDYRLCGDEVFQFGDELEMIVQESGLIELKDEESFDVVDEKILEKSMHQKQYNIFHDNYRAEEGSSRRYSYIHVQMRFVRTPNKQWNFVAVSNKTTSSFSIGSSNEAKLCNFLSRNTDPYQCELVLKNEVWYLRELPHTDRRRRTWIGMFGNYKNNKKLIKYKGASFVERPRQNHLEITEDRDILVGRTIVEMTFGKSMRVGPN